ncbi:MAG: hypothetical protein FWG63_01085 [Defluviitaleaceae bacterium]|nr:hypothetical protein [Defluviitaleaceae bacterium]
MYKKSVYNIEVDKLEDDKLLFFNTRTTAFGIMDRPTKALYDGIEQFNQNTIENDTLKNNFETLVNNRWSINS